MQQTFSQLLNSLLTLVGVLAMMLMDLAAARAGRARVGAAVVRRDAADREAVAADVRDAVGADRPAERAHRGDLHRSRAGAGVRPPGGGRGGVPGAQRGALQGELRRAVPVRHHPAGDHVHREPQLRLRRRDRRPAGRLGLDVAGRRAGVHPVLPPVQPAAHPGGLDVQPAAVRRRLGRAGLRAARRGRAGAGPGHPRRWRDGPGPGGVRARVVPLRAGRAADRGPLAGRRPGTVGGDRRPDRRRQDDAGQPDHALLRAGRRSHHVRRARHRDHGPRRAARPDRHGAAGRLAVRRHDPRQHRLRPAGRHRGGDPRGRAGHLRRPLRPLAAGRLRHGDRRRGQQHQRRRAAAGHHRPRLPGRAVAAHPGRGDQLGRHPHRGARAEGDGRAAVRPDQLHHRPPALDHPGRRPDPRDGGGADRRAGHARRAAGPPRRVRRPLQRPVPRRHREEESA